MKTNEQTVIVENPTNGQKITLQPLFDYLQAHSETFSSETKIDFQTVPKMIDTMIENQISFAATIVDKLDFDAQICPPMKSFLESLKDAIELKKVFQNMILE